MNDQANDVAQALKAQGQEIERFREYDSQPRFSWGPTSQRNPGVLKQIVEAVRQWAWEDQLPSEEQKDRAGNFVRCILRHPTGEGKG